MNKQSLDRYITGNYGEDQFKNTKEPRAYYYGRKARLAGRDKRYCRCKSKQAKQFWLSGWAEADMEERMAQCQSENQESE